MTCDRIPLSGGGSAIVCSSRKRERCDCGRPATLLCDWKVQTRKSGTCDAPLCARCAHKPAPGKDLCPAHRTAFEQWRAAPRAPRLSPISGGEVTNPAPTPDRPAVAPARPVLTEGACP